MRAPRRGEARRVRGAAGHEIGDDAWYTAIVDWILVGLASVPVLPRSGGHLTSKPTGRSTSTYAGRLPVADETAIQQQARGAPTLLRSWTPQLLDPAERDECGPLVHKTTPQLASRNSPTSPVGYTPLSSW